MAQVQAYALRGLLKYIKEKAGEEVRKKIIDSLTEDRDIYSKSISSGWYPYSAFVRLIEAIDRELGNGDLSLCKEMGKWAVERDISGIGMYNIYTQDDFKTTMVFKTAPNVMWKGYYSEGKMETTQLPETMGEPNSLILKVIDFPEMKKAHCSLLEGWVGGAYTVVSGKNATVRQTKCITRGDEYCEFVFEKE